MVRRGILGDAQMLFQSDYGQYQVAWLAPLYGLDPPPTRGGKGFTGRLRRTEIKACLPPPGPPSL